VNAETFGLRFDRKRKDKTTSNDDWKSEIDPDARIARMKDGTTHLAYKAEHVADLEADLILATEVRAATDADTATLADSLAAAQLNLAASGSKAVIEEVAGDKGYHAAKALEMCDFLEVRTYIPEPKRREAADGSTNGGSKKKSKRRSKRAEKPEAERRAVANNRLRMGRAKGKRLQRRRSELVVRTFAHVCETGGSRRNHLRGLANVTKRYVIAAAAHNLGRILRKLTGVGKPKALQGAVGGLSALGERLAARWEAVGRMLERMVVAYRREAEGGLLRLTA
jgi:transposase